MITINGKAMEFVQEKGRTQVKRGRRMKNGWEKKRENSLILKLAQQVNRSIFLQNELTN